MRRIAFYSYDERGVGHVRRSIAIAHAIAADRPSSILLVAGAREAALFKLPAGTDTLALPAPSTDFNGDRRGPDTGLDRAGTVHLRARALRNALAAGPEVLIVDRLPLGVHGELADSLGVLRAMGTRLVLGLRDVLDGPEEVRAELARTNAFEILRTHYDAVWVYGDPDVHDAVAEYDLPADVAAMVRYTGYLDRRPAERPAGRDLVARRRELRLPDDRLALCVLGGGEDGRALATAFARAALPAGTTGVVVAGPFMPDADRDALHALVAGRDDMRVLDFVPDADTLIALADDVVAMGGYNAVCEIVASGSRALVVPRTRPREQLIRAHRLAALGALDVLEPADLHPDAIARWVADGPAEPAPRPRADVDLDGLDRIPALLDALAAEDEDRPRFAHGDGRRAARTGSLPA